MQVVSNFGEVSLGWNFWMRQIHRWLSIVFTAAIVVIFIVKGMGKEPATWLYLTPLPPLFLLLFTGLYLFVLPYVTRARNRRA